MRGDGPVGEAQYRRGPLLGHQVAEGREESPQFRLQQFRDCQAVSRDAVRCPAVRRRYRLSGRGLAHAPRGPMGMESGHPVGPSGQGPPALSRPMATERPPALHESILMPGHQCARSGRPGRPLGRAGPRARGDIQFSLVM